ncbi:hypothetical protein V8E36_002057 [Tilletia maclaganii]
MVHPSGSGASASTSAVMPRQRIDTLAIKARLGAALGDNQIHYWHALRSFCTAALDRAEFEQLARGYLGKDLIHLHNALIMGILHNASPGVPGPSTDDDPSGSGGKRGNPGDPDPNATVEVPSRKRQRLVLAGLPKRERQRIKLVGKLSRASSATTAAATSSATTTTSSSLSALGPTLSAAGISGSGTVDGIGGARNAENAALLAGGVGWAGANAEMLERKRKEQEKRKAADEKRRIRENLTNIGARDWRGETMQQAEELESISDKLSASTQSAIARALSASLCIDSKELPDIEALRDRMTLHAVEAGLPGGVHPQAAAMLLLALQGHIQTVISSVVSKLRTRGTRSAMSDSAGISAATAAAMAEALRQQEALSDDDDEGEESHPPTGLLSTIENQPSSLRRTNSTATLRPMSYASASYSENAKPLLSSASARLPPTDVLNLARTAATATTTTTRAEVGGQHTLKLSDIAMLLDLAPHTVVEPLGLGTQERMLAPEYEGNLESGSQFQQGGGNDDIGRGLAEKRFQHVRSFRSLSEEEVAAAI